MKQVTSKEAAVLTYLARHGEAGDQEWRQLTCALTNNGKEVASRLENHTKSVQRVAHSGQLPGKRLGTAAKRDRQLKG